MFPFQLLLSDLWRGDLEWPDVLMSFHFDFKLCQMKDVIKRSNSTQINNEFATKTFLFKDMAAA